MCGAGKLHTHSLLEGSIYSLWTTPLQKIKVRTYYVKKKGKKYFMKFHLATKLNATFRSIFCNSAAGDLKKKWKKSHLSQKALSTQYLKLFSMDKRTLCSFIWPLAFWMHNIFATSILECLHLTFCPILDPQKVHEPERFWLQEICSTALQCTGLILMKTPIAIVY